MTAAVNELAAMLNAARGAVGDRNLHPAVAEVVQLAQALGAIPPQL